MCGSCTNRTGSKADSWKREKRMKTGLALPALAAPQSQLQTISKKIGQSNQLNFMALLTRACRTVH